MRASVSERTSLFTARQGFEPRLNGPKPFVLPLHHQASEGRINCGESPTRQALKLTKNAKPRIDDPNALWLNTFLMSSDTNPASQPKYKRIILKLSGEVLRSSKTGDPIDWDTLARICEQIKDIRSLGTEVGIVIGGGNIFRGLSGSKDRGVDRTTGDYMGMLSTVINGLAFMECLEKMDVVTRVQTSIPMNQVAEPFILRRAIRHLEKGRVVIFVAGTGNPYFSTDTTAALRASELQAEVIMKATKVDGVYDKDPMENDDAVLYEQLSYLDALQQRLNILDSTAFSLCMDNEVPILVFSLNEEDGIRRAILGEKVGTLVCSESSLSALKRH